MLSHEVKNYALLTYDGALIVRGAAFHSSRSEPFGERFLREALRHALIGDAEAVQRAYLDTVVALRERRLTPFDVATVTRLAKSDGEYAASRGRAREAAYEALLAAGRTHWRSGERVRFYRATDGTPTWLQEASEHDTSGADDAGPAERAAGSLPEYDMGHYLAVLHTSYVSRLRKAFAPDDFEQLFRRTGQGGLFDRPIDEVRPRWIEA